jgi:hypothetical protein
VIKAIEVAPLLLALEVAPQPEIQIIKLVKVSPKILLDMD